ncbi:MAG TPA: hypothetical protein VFM09_10195 [Marmoricola sp.]|nr:hypothetical protein [Marmoricola sp.]
MRVRTVVPLSLGAVLLALALPLAGCSSGRPEVPAGCGLARPAAVTALTGTPATARVHGSLQALREHGRRLGCSTATHGRQGRRLDIEVVRHPAPMRLPRRHCAEGWVYAGRPQHYAPACQVHHGAGGTTILLRRAGDYVISVVVRRPDTRWAGDAEEALVVADEVAARIG